MGPATVGAETVVGCFLRRAAERASEPLWYHQTNGRWQPVTWDEARSRVIDLAAGLASLGIAPGDRVGLLGTNSPAWVIADYAIQHVGAVVVPLYATSKPDQIARTLTDTGVRVCLADGIEMTGLVREASAAGLQTLVALHLGEESHGQVVGLGDLIERGEAWAREHPNTLEDTLASIRPDLIATVVFTSGAGGEPRGVLLSHHNLLWTARSAAARVGIEAREKTLSFLPLPHVFERVMTTVIPLVATTESWTCWFVDDIAKLPGALRSVRPTIFAAVPLVWSRLRSRIQAEIAASGRARRAVDELLHETIHTSTAGPLGSRTARMLGRKVLKKVGLDRCRYAVSGAAPLQPDTQRFLQALGIPLHQGWGMTETTALTTVQHPDDLEVGLVGAPLDGIEIRIKSDGEILVRGPSVFAGYDGELERTVAAFDEEGWFHTGDVGVLTEDGRLRITDRLKDLIVTAGGRNVAPRAIEERLRGDPLITGAIVIGEGRPYLTALIAIDGQIASHVADDHQPTDTGLWEHPRVRQRVERAVEMVNRSLSGPEQLHHFAILPFGFPDEALTPTLKLKRRVVEETFADVIEGMYA